MSDATPEHDSIDVDPYADADGRVGELFVDEVGEATALLVGDPDLWVTPPDELREQILESFRADQQALEPQTSGREANGPGVLSIRLLQLRPALLGAAAALVLFIGGVIAFSAAGGSPAPVAFAADMVPTGEIADVEGRVEVTSLRTGLKIELDAPSLPRRAEGLYYEGWLHLDDGRSVPIGTFHEGEGVSLWAGIEIEIVVDMTITMEEAVAADGTGSESSGRVVLKVDFPD